MKGKNFSCNNIGQRKKSDFYETPYSITQQLLDFLQLPLQYTILEPACGNYAISKVLNQNKYKTITKDIKYNQNFLNETGYYDIIITNPPYSLAFEFIQKAKTLTNYFCFLLPLAYLHGKKRYDYIYTDEKYKLSKILVFTRYPLLGEPLRQDGKYHTGMMVYAWFIWKKGSKNTTIHWADNNMYVISKND